MYINLSGLNILVSGASGSLGKAICAKLAEAGATIAVHYNKRIDDAENLAHVLGNGSRAFQADLTKPGEAHTLYEKVISKYGTVEVLINNAGSPFSGDKTSGEKDWQDHWDRTINLNLSASAVLCKKFVDQAVKRKAIGRIINVTSNQAFEGALEENIAYAAAKAGLENLTRSIARTYGDNGIYSFNVCPGYIRSNALKDYADKYGETEIKPRINLSRQTEPRDISPLVAFLSSGMCDHATGSTFDLNGGSYFH